MAIYFVGSLEALPLLNWWSSTKNKCSSLNQCSYSWILFCPPHLETICEIMFLESSGEQSACKQCAPWFIVENPTYNWKQVTLEFKQENIVNAIIASGIGTTGVVPIPQSFQLVLLEGLFFLLSLIAMKEIVRSVIAFREGGPNYDPLETCPPISQFSLEEKSTRVSNGKNFMQTHRLRCFWNKT